LVDNAKNKFPLAVCFVWDLPAFSDFYSRIMQIRFLASDSGEPILQNKEQKLIILG